MTQTRAPQLQADAKHDLTAQIIRLQKKLLLGFLIPGLVVIVLGVYAVRLSSRLEQVEALEQTDFIERFYKDARNLPWAIDRYNQLLTTHRSPLVLARLGNLYFERSRTEGGGFNPRDVELAQNALYEANDLHRKNEKREFWEAFATLTYIELELTVRETDKKKRLKGETKVLQMGEKALILSRRSGSEETYDAQTMNNLAWVYATSENDGIRNVARAKEYAQKAVDLTRRRNADYLDTLAEVSRRDGKDEQALKLLQEARAIKQLLNRGYISERTEEGVQTVGSNRRGGP